MPNAVQYAERELQVHAVYEEAQQRLEQHKAASDAVVTLNGQIRTVKGKIEDMEAVVTSYERSQNPEMSATAFKAHLKSVLDVDVEIKEQRTKLAELEAHREQNQADVKHHELGVRMLTARMDELAGLLEFYGAAKRAQGDSKE